MPKELSQEVKTQPTENEIQTQFWRVYQNKFALIVPNYRPMFWNECDIAAITKNGHFYEFEIKRNIPDFWADKFKLAYSGQSNPANKQHLLRSGNCVPQRFFYVMPETEGHVLKQDNDIPDFAGLIIFRETRAGLSFDELIAAPKLHDKPYCSRKTVPTRLASALGCRYWGERLRNSQKGGK